MTLEDHIRFGIEMTARPWREMIGSTDRAAAGSARAVMADSITEALTLSAAARGRRIDRQVGGANGDGCSCSGSGLMKSTAGFIHFWTIGAR
jgi:hypothetical protein